MGSSAEGIHAHPTRKLGKAPPVDKPKLRLARLLTGQVPVHPSGADFLGSTDYGLDGNDQYGVCVPTSYDNYRRLSTAVFFGSAVEASQDQIFSWYKTQNPGFDPVNYNEANDQGMVIQDFLNMLVKTGEIVAFAAVDTSDLEELKAAIFLFLGLICGVNLKRAQDDQLNGAPPVWDAVMSGDWGGHAIMLGAYEENGLDCITWDMRVRMTANFISEQMDEAWVVIRPEHLANPEFRQGIDYSALAAGYRELTGRELPSQPTPPNPPPTEPGAQADLTLNITDPEVIQHITKVSKSTSPDLWATHHFRSYFRIK